jgi:hypothetical protein
MLLLEYILIREPDTNLNVQVVCVPIWKEESEMEKRGGWRNWLSVKCLNFIDDKNNDSVLIVDEVQASYWDRDFWLNTIKQMKSTTPHRIITFASYGSTGSSNPALATPFFAQPSQTIGLQSINNADGKTQLRLSKEEFFDFVNTAFLNPRFDSALLDSFYDLTNGHVGACYDVLTTVIYEDEVSRTRKAHFPMNLIP